MGLFYTILFNNILLIRRKEQQLTISKDKTLYFDQTPIFSVDIDGEIQIKPKQKEGKHMSIYSDPILVTLSYDDSFITLQTYDEKHGKSQRFFLSKEALTHNATEIDLQNVCTVTHYGKAVLFCLYWLHSNCDDGLYGYQQGFRIPEEKINQVLKGETIRHLSYTQHKKARIFFTKPAHETIGQCNKLERHALRRFFRDQFNYDEDIVVQRDQLVRGFYFFSTLTPYEGGIVRHTSTVRDSFSRTHEKVAFSIHT